MDPLSIIAAVFQLTEGATALLERARDYRDSADVLEQLHTKFNQLDDLRSALTDLLHQPVFESIDTTGIQLPLAQINHAKRIFDSHFVPCAGPGLTSRFKRTLNRRRIKMITHDIAEAERGLCMAHHFLTLSVVTAQVSPRTHTLETSAAFQPEKYVAIEPIFASLHVFCTQEISRADAALTFKFFLSYSQGARCCKRVIICATILPAADQKPVKPFVDDLQRPGRRLRLLPNRLMPQLEGLLRTTEDQLFDSVTIISIAVKYETANEARVNTSAYRIAEDREEASLTSVSELIPELDVLGLPHYSEKEVAKIRKLYLDGFVVIVNAMLCIQWQIPFASGVGGGGNLARDFVGDMRLALAAQNCRGVAKFMGVVLTDDGTMVRGTLMELPARGALIDLLIRTEREGLSISWPRRAKWIRQLISAVADVHSRGSVVGVISTHNIWIDDADNITLPEFNSSSSNLRHDMAAVPPELRVPSRPPFTAATDIFQLGWTVWNIAQCLVNTKEELCRRANCTLLKPHMCQAPHAMPVQLPACTGNVPTYIDDIINQCRSLDARHRTAAAKLLLLQLPEEAADGRCESSMNFIDSEVPQLRGHCDICNTIFFDEFYRCDICSGGNYQLCSICFLKHRYHCWDPQHQLSRTIRKHSTWIDAES